MNARSRLRANRPRFVVGVVLLAVGLVLPLLGGQVGYWLGVVPGFLGLVALGIGAEDVVFGRMRERDQRERRFKEGGN